MSKPSFIKYSGAGNNFVLIDDRQSTFPINQTIKQICHDADVDGLILLQLDAVADFRMRIFNCDGSEAESCGNGLRCLLQFLLDLGLPKKSYSIAAADRIVIGEFYNDRIGIQMGLPRHRQTHKIDQWEVHSIDTGVPHAVLFVPDVQAIDVLTLGAYLRHHRAFHPRGTNVNFVSPALHVRTFERGVESEVFSCGTGAAAVAVIASEFYALSNPIHLHFRGGILEVHWSPPHLALFGSVRKIL